MKTKTSIKPAEPVDKKDHCAYDNRDCDHSCPSCRFGGDSGMM